MRLVSYVHNGIQGAGVIDGELIRPLPYGVRLLDLLEQDALADAELHVVDPPVPLADARLLPPLTPPSVRDFVTFEQHVEGIAQRFGGRIAPEWYAAPTFYFTNPHAMIGAHDDLPVPPGCRVLDYELEVAAVIGRAGRDLSPEQARDHIAGYVIFNDWSARDLQAREMPVQLGPAKGKDFATTLGPFLVTADELEPCRTAEGLLDLAMTVQVNGVETGRDSLANMAWTFEELTAYAARGAWVRPGDVLGSGTCGSGCLAELWGRSGAEDPPPLRVGDVVTMTVTGLGTISNRVVPGVDPVPLPPARVRHSSRACSSE
ncbi:fumarylacetoacetate hydrolase family protein [Kutzneria sp. CA-103260]|uniref:fumarylacetoacetate hydrolase family protein n=1 Tax=Kutzneria sp. CA-103260 TaxID=2802641 RepID=UPI001BAD5B7F|nr:fumarylacetoacetate hydrolase family protein [Kutzneria sp. CA-103260]QUQ64133.1 hydroxylase [Kutzneria sp. CA-103260]